MWSNWRFRDVRPYDFGNWCQVISMKNDHVKPLIINVFEIFKNFLQLVSSLRNWVVKATEISSKPDLVINRFALAIFVDGGFWHGYNWSLKKNEIKSNRDFWIAKIEGNMKRDSATNEKLETMGFTVMRFWDHQVKKNLAACVNQILL